jgi:hypothetical protein
MDPFDEKIAVQHEGYSVVFTQDNRIMNAEATFISEAMAIDYMQQMINTNPHSQGTIHVIPNYEVNRS